jgi:hypothetical protein
VYEVRKRGMKKAEERAELTRPELGLFAATRAMLGAGVGLLVADKLGEDERKVIRVDTISNGSG